MGWVTSGIKTINLAAQVLADSGALPEGSGNIKLLVSSSVLVIITFEQRNAANDTIVKSQAFFCPAGDMRDAEIMVSLAEGERFRLTIGALAAGNVQGSLSSGMW